MLQSPFKTYIPISICLYESYSWTNFFTTSKHICTASYRKCPNYPLPTFHCIQGLMQCVASWRLSTSIYSESIHNRQTKFYFNCAVVIGRKWANAPFKKKNPKFCPPFPN